MSQRQQGQLIGIQFTGQRILGERGEGVEFRVVDHKGTSCNRCWPGRFGPLAGNRNDFGRNNTEKCMTLFYSKDIIKARSIHTLLWKSSSVNNMRVYSRGVWNLL